MDVSDAVQVNGPTDCKDQGVALVGTERETNFVSNEGELLHQGLPVPVATGENEPTGDEDETLQSEDAVSFVEAVINKYNDMYGLTIVDGVILPKFKYKPVDLTESGTILLPRQLSMSGCNISVAGDDEVIRSMCPRMEELDLMSNDFKSWGEVFDIVKGAPQLTFLNLSQNYIPASTFPDLSDLSSCGLPSLTGLVLNDTKVTWSVVMRLLQAFPRIESLHLSVNELNSFDIPDSGPPYRSLRSLYFVGNTITDWREINRMGSFFPELECLMLSETNIARLAGEDNLHNYFPNLRILGLNRTCIESWQEVEKLRKLPCLTDVRLRFIPFLQAQPKDVLRHHTIALLPRITLLNQTPISEDERENAERAYIRLYMDLEQRPARYDELERIHGKLDRLNNLSLKPKSSVRVTVKVEDIDDDESVSQAQAGQEMDVEVKTTMKDLRKLLSNIANHPATKLRLYHGDRQDGDTKAERMIYPSRSMLGYHVNDGDEIIVVKMP